MGNSKEAEYHILSGQRRQFVGTQLNFFFSKKITTSYSHVLIIINVNMMKQLCTRTI